MDLQSGITWDLPPLLLPAILSFMWGCVTESKTKDGPGSLNGTILSVTAKVTA